MALGILVWGGELSLYQLYDIIILVECYILWPRIARKSLPPTPSLPSMSP